MILSRPVEGYGYVPYRFQIALRPSSDCFRIVFRFFSVFKFFHGRPETVMCKLCAVLCARAFPAYGQKRSLDGREKKLKKYLKTCFIIVFLVFSNARLLGGREACAEATVWGARRPVQRFVWAPGGPCRGHRLRPQEARPEAVGGDKAHMFAHMKRSYEMHISKHT